MFLSLTRWLSRNRTRTTRNDKNRRRRLESLETRLPLAGNVAAAVVATNLNIQGDVLDNQIKIRHLGGNFYQVVGLGGTTINGMASQVFGGVTGNIQASMSRGNDVVLIDEAFSSPGNLGLDMGDGHDLVHLLGPTAGAIRINGSLNLSTGHGHDEVRLHGVTVRGDTMIDSGLENDTVGAYQLQVGGHLGILTRAGDDFVSLNRTVVRGATRIATDDGNDQLHIGGSHFVGSFSALTGNGHDRFRLVDTAFGDFFLFHAGEGNDRVDVFGKVMFQQPATLSLGGGDDIAVVDAAASIDNAANLTWDGGLGFDTLVDAPGNYTNPALVARVNF